MTEESLPDHPDEARNGGAAFPYVSHGAWSDHQYAQAGMTLRDWFAGQALAGMANDYGDSAPGYAYKIADRMLEERARHAPTPAAEEGA